MIESVVESAYGYGQLHVFLDRETGAVVVKKKGKVLATGRWEGQFVVSSHVGLMGADRMAVSYVLRFEMQS